MKHPYPFKILFASLTILLFSYNSALSAEPTQKLKLSSTAFADGMRMPKKYTGDGAGVSPPLAWNAGPKGTKSYAVCCSDPDAVGETFWHWIVFNISAKTPQLGENLAKVATLAQGVAQGSNDARSPGYRGPTPPDKIVHHYVFQVRALDTMLSIKPGSDKTAFNSAIKDHILAEGQLIGTYQR